MKNHYVIHANCQSEALLDQLAAHVDFSRDFELNLVVNLPGLVEQPLERERAKHARTPVAYLDLVMEPWRTHTLFHTMNHPSPESLSMVVDALPAFAGHYVNCRLLSEANFIDYLRLAAKDSLPKAQNVGSHSCA
ncbi:WcbI family polysaccharide biosynthesis putative acetyltransferase [Desulfocurvibacter africanus]|uniref:WcbI family polysaccharide biosynthesis putative acetyltransferase n=1 Tax=Desulfocurvibacter africanus TaxID=873 RepID=UPI0003F5B0FF|nr:WcbI family polysaccharide biosynthesis putative acetyltransferase [Desulfocurvibacter africanus]